MNVALIPQAFTDADDLYNFSMGLVAQQWPDCMVTYEYTNRDKNFQFRPGFARELRRQLEMLSDVIMSQEEFDFFVERTPWLPLPYLQWLRQYRFNPDQVELRQEGGKLYITIKGRWYETIYWEVKLLSIISQLHSTDPRTGLMLELPANWQDHIHRKAEKLSNAGVQWVDFGTRRRFSFEVQDAVVRIMKEYSGFRGTSNPYLAMKYGVKAIGTYAHQLPMAMQALYGHRSADRMAMEHWVRQYRGNLGTALGDTLTSGHFLTQFDSYFANLFTGTRQDSGDPVSYGERMISHYTQLGINPITKMVVFSDSLTDDKAIMLHRHFEGRILTIMGIGTFLTADAAMTGVKPMNHVIKLRTADFGNGPVQLVKLSDDEGKYTGDPDMVQLVKKFLNV